MYLFTCLTLVQLLRAGISVILTNNKHNSQFQIQPDQVRQCSWMANRTICWELAALDLMPILPAVFVKSLHSHFSLKNQLPPVTFWRYQLEQIHFNIIKVYTHTTQRDLQQPVGRPHTSAPSCSVCPLPELSLALPSQTTTQDTALDHCGVGTPLALKSVIFLLTQWVPVGRKQGTETGSYIRENL